MSSPAGIDPFSRVDSEQRRRAGYFGRGSSVTATCGGRVLIASWVFCIAVVSAFSLLPASAAPRLPGGGIFEHPAAYFALALLPTVAMQSARNVFIAILSMAGLGVLLEILQIAIPGRAFEWANIVMNFLGLISGVLAGVLGRVGSRHRVLSN